MRCRYCGSKMIHPEVRHKTFSTGKAVAGAVTFGVVGAAAGMIGKDLKGYQCGQCGAFMESAMDFSTELSVDSAIREAQSGGSRAMYDYFKGQYCNIHADIPAQSPGVAAPAQAYVPVQADARLLGGSADTVSVKQSCRNLSWDPDCPTYIDTITITCGSGNDKLALLVYNQSKKTIRSAYYEVKVYDDTFDLVETVKCVYQGIEVAPGQTLPTDKQFDLKTDLAYKVDIECEKVAFTDDEVWRSSGKPARVLTEQTELTEENFPRLRYVKRDLAKVSRADAKGKLYLPVKGEGYWQCICKQPSLSGEACANCGAEYEKLEALLSQTRLVEEQKKAVMARAAKRAEATMAAYEAARKEGYAKAVALTEKRDVASLKEATALFEKLGDYEDSAACFDALNQALPALTEKLRAEQAAEEARRQEERRAEQEAAEQARKEQEEQAKNQKKKENAKGYIWVLAYLLNYVAGSLGANAWLANMLNSYGLPSNGLIGFSILALVPTTCFVVAVNVYSLLIGKQKVRTGRAFKAAFTVFILSLLYSIAQMTTIILVGKGVWMTIAGILANLLIYYIGAASYCKEKKKKKAK